MVRHGKVKSLMRRTLPAVLACMGRGGEPKPLGAVVDDVMAGLTPTAEREAEDDADFVALGLIISRHENPVEWLFCVCVGLAIATESDEERLHAIIRDAYRRHRPPADDGTPSGTTN